MRRRRRIVVVESAHCRGTTASRTGRSLQRGDPPTDSPGSPSPSRDCGFVDPPPPRHCAVAHLPGCHRGIGETLEGDVTTASLQPGLGTTGLLPLPQGQESAEGDAVRDSGSRSTRYDEGSRRLTDCRLPGGVRGLENPVPQGHRLQWGLL